MFKHLHKFHLPLEVMQELRYNLLLIQDWVSPFDRPRILPEKSMWFIGAWLKDNPKIFEPLIPYVNPLPYKISVARIYANTQSPIHSDVDHGKIYHAKINIMFAGNVETIWYDEQDNAYERMEMEALKPILLNVGKPHRAFNHTDKDIEFLGLHFDGSFEAATEIFE